MIHRTFKRAALFGSSSNCGVSKHYRPKKLRAYFIFGSRPFGVRLLPLRLALNSSSKGESRNGHEGAPVDAGAGLPVNIKPSRHHVICHFNFSSPPAPARERIPIPILVLQDHTHTYIHTQTHALNLISVQNLTLIAFPFLSQTYEYLPKTLVDTLLSVHLYPQVDNYVNLTALYSTCIHAIAAMTDRN